MKLLLTKHFDGEVVETLGEAKTQDELIKILYDWKAKEEKKKSSKYRIQPYNVFTLTNSGTVIDFGDYIWFCKIPNV